MDDANGIDAKLCEKIGLGSGGFVIMEDFFRETVPGQVLAFLFSVEQLNAARGER